MHAAHKRKKNKGLIVHGFLSKIIQMHPFFRYLHMPEKVFHRADKGPGSHHEIVHGSGIRDMGADQLLIDAGHFGGEDRDVHKGFKGYGPQVLSADHILLMAVGMEEANRGPM
jgi:hypothetical protein